MFMERAGCKSSMLSFHVFAHSHTFGIGQPRFGISEGIRESGLEIGAASYKKRLIAAKRMNGEAFTFPDISKMTLFIFRYGVTRPGI